MKTKMKIIIPKTKCTREIDPIDKDKNRNRQELKTDAIYDTGSNVSLINEKLVRILKKKSEKDEQVFKTINGANFTKNRVSLMLEIGDISRKVNLYTVKNDHFEYGVLLGLDNIKAFSLIQDENLNIYQKNKKYSKNSLKKSDKNKQCPEIHLTEYLNFNEYESYLNHLDKEKKDKILKLLRKKESAFAKNKYDVGKVKGVEAKVKLTENKYFSKHPYRCLISDQKEISEQTKKLLENKFIEESSAPYAAPVTLSMKRDNNSRSRLCCDYRDLNSIIVPESHPFPRIEDIMVKAGKSKWFTALDINSAFWSIQVREKDRDKLSFITQEGLYKWNVVPFGLKTSSSIFQRTVANILRKNKLNGFAINYIDDILIFSDTFEEHIEHIKLVIEILENEGLKLKLSKCNFAKNSINFLGHIIEEGKIRPYKDNLIAIEKFNKPKNKKNIRQFLGKVNFYHKYIENAVELFEPLHNLLRKNVKFIWDDRCEESFRKIKKYLCTCPILAIYNETKEVYIYTDASQEGVAAILKQPDENGALHPVAYFSKKLNPTQKKRKAIYLECLAIKEAIKYWVYWLIDRKFTVITDHKPLENLKVKARTDEPLGI